MVLPHLLRKNQNMTLRVLICIPGASCACTTAAQAQEAIHVFLEREDRIAWTTPSGVRIVSTRMQVHILCSVNFYFVLIIQFFDQVSGGKSMCFKLETSDNSHQYLVAIRSARTLTHPRVLHTHCPASFEARVRSEYTLNLLLPINHCPYLSQPTRSLHEGAACD